MKEKNLLQLEIIKDGIPFTKDFNILDLFLKAECNYEKKTNSIMNKNDKEIGVYIPKNSFYKYFEKQLGINDFDKLPKKLLFAEYFFNKNTNTLYLIDKRFQEAPSSNDEKMLLCDYKVKQYQKFFSDYGINVKCLFILSNLFLNEDYEEYLEYIKLSGNAYCVDNVKLNILGISFDDLIK